MEVIDSHHHLWKYNPKDYGWMDDSMEVLKKDYFPNDLVGELNQAGVGGTVVVQARQTEEETTWLLSLAEQYNFIRGVVGWIDLQAENISDRLNLFAGHPKLVGVRHVIHDEPDIDFMRGNKFIRGIACLEKYDLTYDLLVFPEHLENTIRFVDRFPTQRFVVDHIAKPSICSGAIDHWKTGISRLAKNKNVYCKISGMVTEANHEKWRYSDFLPYLDVVTEAFGVDRLMIGSDWPVCRLAAEYNQVLEIPKRYYADFDMTEKAKIFKQNCIKFYHLDK